MAATTIAEFSAEDAFSASLGLLFDHQLAAIVVPSHELWTHEPTGIVLAIPNVQDAANWSLHADAVWTASLFLANHFNTFGKSLDLAGKRVLELGAGSGLAGIVTERLLSPSKVVITDYPDEGIISTLRENVKRNKCERAIVQPLNWGDIEGLKGQKFHAIIAADTLWNIELHPAFCQTLSAALSQEDSSRVHLLAGFHTGRYTLRHFMRVVDDSELEVELLREYRVSDGLEREWQVERIEEDASEANRWLLYIQLKHRKGKFEVN